jgi:hypothetical protein
VRKWFAALDGSDVLGVGGFGAALYGVAQWSAPAAWVCGGLVLMAVAIAPTFKKRGN